MAHKIDLETEIATTRELLREKLGVRARDLASALRRARYRLPRRVYNRGMLLAGAQDRARHPKLRLTLDMPVLAGAAREIQAHLRAIDLADRRKGWWLGMLGGLAFNILLLIALVIAFLVWRGLI